MNATPRLRDCRALITGGGRGIGRSICLAFAREGASIAVAARTRGEVEAVAGECRSLGVDAFPVQLDVSLRSSCEDGVRQCESRWGALDILVNNAGVAEARRFAELDDELWERTLAVDLTGAFHMTQAAIPTMLDRGEGAVISVASIAGKVGARYYTAYSAAKHGLIGFMRSLAAEYAGSGVTFNCVCPAFTDTPMTEEAVARIMARTGRSREQVVQSLATPQGRLVRPEEVAALCVLLASQDGRGINGQSINVDGGQVQG